MARSWGRRGVYLAAGCTASACASSPDDTAGDAAPVLVPLAEAGALLPLGAAPATAWQLAQGWAAAGGDCPARTPADGGYVLTGGCTLPDGRALDGAVTVVESPAGGTWTFAALSLDGLTVDGGVAWVRTDEANTLSAWELEATRGDAGVRYSSYVATMAESGAWRAAEGRGEWRAGPGGTAGTHALSAPADCATPGGGDWVAEPEAVHATLRADGCGCDEWAGADASGAWCDE